MKKIILTIGISALVTGTSLMADHTKKDDKIGEVLAVMIVNGDQPVGCLGYGKGRIASGPDLTLESKYKGRRLITTCKFHIENFDIPEEISGNGFMCLLSDLGDESVKFGQTKHSSYSLTVDGDGTLTCSFKGHKKDE